MALRDKSGSSGMWSDEMKNGSDEGDRWCFFHRSSLFYHFLVIYSSLFYQNIVSLHADVLYFFSDLNKIIELCIYNER